MFNGPSSTLAVVFESLFTSPPTLTGRVVRLEPLAPAHEEGLWKAAQDPRVWQWLPMYGIETRERFGELFADGLARTAAGAEFAFATLDAASGRPIGSSRYLTLRPEHRGLEIGWTWLEPSAWGTGANVEAKRLMLEHAFESLGCMRVEFKTDARNERSRGALAALPAQFEGIFRRHMIVRDGDVRDSAYYSITDHEWPDVRAALAARLPAG